METLTDITLYCTAFFYLLQEEIEKNLNFFQNKPKRIEEKVGNSSH
jgi:hypothetical protein